MKRILLVVIFAWSHTLLAQAPYCFRIEKDGAQVIKAWEVVADVGSFCDPNFGRKRDLMLDSLVASTFVDRISVEVRSGLENNTDHFAIYHSHGCPTGSDPAYQDWLLHRYEIVNDNADTTTRTQGFQFSELDLVMDSIVVPLRRRLEARGRTLQLNLFYNAGPDTLTQNFVHLDPKEYAEFVAAVYSHLQAKYEWAPYSWDVFYEPDQWRLMNPFVLGDLTVASGDLLQARGFAVRFVGPSINPMNDNWQIVTRFLATPRILPYMMAVSFHRTNGDRLARYRSLLGWDQQYKLPVAMTHSDLSNDLVNGFFYDVRLAHASIVSCGPISGLFDVVQTDSTIAIRRSHSGAYLSHILGTVRPGAQFFAPYFQDCSVLIFQNPDQQQYIHYIREDPWTTVEANIPYATYRHTYTDTNLVTRVDSIIVGERQVPIWGARHSFKIATLQLASTFTDVPSSHEPTSLDPMVVERTADQPVVVVRLIEQSYITIRCTDLLGRSEVVYEGMSPAIARYSLSVHGNAPVFITMSVPATGVVVTVPLLP